MKYHLVVSATGLLLITACTPPPKLAFESTWYFEQRVIEPAGNGIKTYSANSEEVDQGMPTSQPGNEQVSPELPPPSAVICTDLNVGVINRTPHRVPISRLELNPVDWDRKRNVPKGFVDKVSFSEDRVIDNGQLIYERLATFRGDGLPCDIGDKIWLCRLPAAVYVTVPGQDVEARVPARMLEVLPTSVPLGWHRICKAESPTEDAPTSDMPCPCLAEETDDNRYPQSHPPPTRLHPETTQRGTH